jgi:hypothetical protein
MRCANEVYGSGFSRTASRYRTHRRLRTDTGSTIRSERKRRLLAIHFTDTANHREYPCSANNCGLTAIYFADPASTSERKRRVFAIYFTDTANHREYPCSANNCGLTAIYSAEPANTRQFPACPCSAAGKYDQGKAEAGPSFRLRYRHYCRECLPPVYRIEHGRGLRGTPRYIGQSFLVLLLLIGPISGYAHRPALPAR